ncbi:MAG: hypothetical protein ACREWG_06635, partial [Gammaproteobacteria bacterium]
MSELVTLGPQLTTSVWSNRNGNGGIDFGCIFVHNTGTHAWFFIRGNTGVYLFGAPFSTTDGQWSFPEPPTGRDRHLAVTMD